MYNKETIILSGILQTMDTDFICTELNKTGWCKKCSERDKTECFLQYGIIPHKRCDLNISREVFEAIWCQYMNSMGETPDTDTENDTFCVRSYDWMDTRKEQWNFWHKPSGIKIEWYKYPLRGAKINMLISPEQFVDILKDCHNSTQTKERCKVLYDCEKWWEK